MVYHVLYFPNPIQSRGDGRCKIIGVLITSLGAAPSLVLEILRIANASTIPISRFIGG